jgi:hypothetical protein
MENIEDIIVSHLIQMHKDAMKILMGNTPPEYPTKFSYVNEQSKVIIGALESLGKYSISNRDN